MNKPILTILAATVATLSMGACSMMDDPTSKPPGTYKDSTMSTAPDGTTYKTNTTTSVYKDGSGDKKAVVKTDSSKDPDGLFNKQDSTTYKTYN